MASNEQMENASARVKVFGADWCAMTTRARGYLDQLGVDYQYINVERDPRASDWVRRQNGGKERKPTLDIDGEVLCVPSQQDVEQVLQAKGLL